MTVNRIRSRLIENTFVFLEFTVSVRSIVYIFRFELSSETTFPDPRFTSVGRTFRVPLSP